MTYEQHDDQQPNIELTPQQLREQQAAEVFKDRVIRDHHRSSTNAYGFSSSAYGRKLVTGSLTIEGDQYNRLLVLAKLIREEATRPITGKATWKPVLLQMLTTIDKAIQTPTKSNIKSYANKETKAEEIVALVMITTLVDYAAINATGGGWAPLQELIERCASRLREQYLDAFCYTLDPVLYSKVERRWQRKHQTGLNKSTNIALGQRAMIATACGISREQHKDSSTRAIVRQVRQELTRIGDDGVSGAPIQLACKHLLDLAIDRLDILVKIKPRWISACRKDIWRVKPTDALIETWQSTVLPALTSNKLLKLPLVEVPELWDFEEALPGRDNVSGGYHLPNVRAANPLVRQHGGQSASVPSASAVELANVMGSTGYLLDHDQTAAYEWAIEKGYEEDLGLPTRPIKTTADLDADATANKLSIESDGFIRDSHGMPLLQGTPEHNEWKAKRRREYDHAVEKQAKYLRTVGVQAGLKDLKQQEQLFYSWSFDNRLRIYPQQSATIHPQGSSIERSLLTFQIGEHIKEGSVAHNEVLQAIGTSWKGDKCSHADRQANGIEAIKELGNQIELHDAADISTLVKAGADDAWALLQQLRCYETTFNQGGLWNVPTGIDASQSGLQILSALCRDEAGMVNTNLILPNNYQPTDAPVDGYRRVANEALELIDKMNFSKASVDNIRALIDGSKARTLSKRVVLPLPYGSTIEGSREAVRKAIKADLGIKNFDEYVDTRDFASTLTGRYRSNHPTIEELRNYFLELPESNTIGWLLSEQIIRDLTTLLRKAAARVYPAAMSALAWLEKLASKAIEHQIATGRSHPQLHWNLHDGSSIWYNRMQKKSRQVPTISCGNIRLVSGDDPTKVNKTKMRQWLAPSVVHSFDGLLLRTAFKDWGSNRPLMCIHDQVSVLPSELPEVRKRLKGAFIEVCENNSLQGIAVGMNIDMSHEKLIVGEADLSRISDSVFMFH